jgi:hypothetical protein
VFVACGGAAGRRRRPDRRRPGAPGVAYLADADVDKQFELYAAALGGSSYRKVSAPLAPGNAY